MKRTCLLTLIFSISLSLAFSANIEIDSSLNSKMVDFAIAKLQKAMDKLELDSDAEEKFIIFVVNAELEAEKLKQSRISVDGLTSEGFRILHIDKRVWVIGGDERGLMYGILDVRDQIDLTNSLFHIEEKIENPRFHFRAIKFNLPWSSYRLGESLQLHMETVKDTLYWVEFLDMMAGNRFNALTLWNLHPYTFMIQPKAFPEATQFTGQEFADWQLFWRTLFRMAKERGIDTYILNWNIVTSPQMTAAHDVANYKDDLEWHYGFTPADTSQIIVDYMRECITQVINEYPNLTGVGVSMGERMKMPIEDAMQWVHDTFVEGIRQLYRNYKEATKAFINVEEMITHPTLDKRYLNIDAFTDRKINKQLIQEEEITPSELAEEMENNGNRILQLCEEIESKASKNQVNFEIERIDIKTWAYLSKYFASKLRGGIYLDEAVKTKNNELRDLSIKHLEQAVTHWEQIINLTSKQYQEVSLLHIKTTKFSWKLFLSQVLKDVEIAQNKEF